MLPVMPPIRQRMLTEEEFYTLGARSPRHVIAGMQDRCAIVAFAGWLLRAGVATDRGRPDAVCRAGRKVDARTAPSNRQDRNGFRRATGMDGVPCTECSAYHAPACGRPASGAEELCRPRFPAKSCSMTGSDKHPSGAPWRNFYGRLKGKGLRDSQKAYLNEDLSALSPGAVGWDENPQRAPLDLGALFGDRPVWLEIGFGGGEHLVHQAALNPDVGIIGCEPYINGVAMLLGKIRAAGVDNLAVHPGDVRDLFDVLPAGSISRAFLLYPDPWPKKRHHRRRFVTPEYLDPLARVLAPGAVLRVATDIPDYVRQTLEEVLARGDFEWLAEGPGDWRAPWGDWISTRYEQKALREGRVPHYLTFRRR